MMVACERIPVCQQRSYGDAVPAAEGDQRRRFNGFEFRCNDGESLHATFAMARICFSAMSKVSSVDIVRRWQFIVHQAEHGVQDRLNSSAFC